MSPPRVCPRPGAGSVGPDCPLFNARLRRAVLVGGHAAVDLRALIRAERTRPMPNPPAPIPTRPALPAPEMELLKDHLIQKGNTQ